MAQEFKGVGLNFNTNIHWTDHLAPLCVIMGIPLLLTDEHHAQEAQLLYPGLNVLLMDWQAINLSYLIQQFDVFFQSQLWHRHDFYRQCQEWEQFYHKTVRNVHCPHGFSDKLFWFEKNVWEDILLVYGNKMLSHFKEAGVADHLNVTVRTGNYRYLYYRTHQAFYDQLVQDRIWSHLDSSKPTILYAPTCHDQEHSTSFFHAHVLIDHLPADYNLIVKVHPLLEETDAAVLFAMMGKYENKSNVIFVKDLPLVYPLLAHADIYIGDMSSVGYDFLAFNRPMFFLNQLNRDAKKDRNLFLYRCGFEIKPDQYKEFYQLLDSQLPFDQERYAANRQAVYQDTFGDEIPFDRLKESIVQAYSSPKKIK